MLMTTVPKCKPWLTVKEELESILNDSASSRRLDHSICLTHGFHHQASFSFKESIKCVAYRSNLLREEFLVSNGIGSRNFFHHRMYDKFEDVDATQIKVEKQRCESFAANRFPIAGQSLEHLIWIPHHKFFIAVGKDKNFRVYSNTKQKCQVISAPTVCPMPVLSIAYLEETDEIVIGGIGIIQPWKIGVFGCGFEDADLKKLHAFKIPKRKQSTGSMGDSQLQQMLQLSAPLPCDFRSEDWVVSLTVIKRKKPVLVAMSSDIIVIIDYVKKHQLWSAFLKNSQAGIGIHQPKVKTQKMHLFDGRLQGKSFYVHGHVSLTRCSFYPRFGYFITGGGEGDIRIVHMVNFGLVTTLRGHRDAISGLIAHPTHSLLLSASSDGSIRIWCLETFKVTQRLDTDQRIIDMRLCTDTNFFYFYSKQQISLYRLTNVCSLYSVMHSSVAKLKRIEGDASLGATAKILVALEDGSVAILSPLTGLILTILYPMNTFQIFSEMVYDPLRNYGYLLLQGGEIIQCDCAVNPATAVRCFVPTNPYHQDVMCLGSVWIRFHCPYGISAIFAGLRNGQIALVHPNTLYMESKQAHTGEVIYLGTISIADNGLKNWDPEECWTSREKLLSVGSSSVRTWFVKPKKSDQGKFSKWEIDLEPDFKVDLPDNMKGCPFYTNVSDYLCVATQDNQILIIDITPNLKSVPTLNFQTQAQLQLPVNPLVSPQSCMSTNNFHRLHTHIQEDDHQGSITALDSSQKLNCFVSSSEDGYVKIWDEENRLMRELCFIPHKVTAMCFVNGRDLLIALEDRICLAELTTFMTRTLIQDRKIVELDFTDDAYESALHYDDKIKIVGNMNEIDMKPLEAFKRTLHPEVFICGDQVVCYVSDRKLPLYSTSPLSFENSSNKSKGSLEAAIEEMKTSSKVRKHSVQRQSLLLTFDRIRRYAEMTHDVYTNDELRERWHRRFAKPEPEKKVSQKLEASTSDEIDDSLNLDDLSDSSLKRRLKMKFNVLEKLRHAQPKRPQFRSLYIADINDTDKNPSKQESVVSRVGFVPNSMIREKVKVKVNPSEKLQWKLNIKKKAEVDKGKDQEQDDSTRTMLFDWTPSPTDLLPEKSTTKDDVSSSKSPKPPEDEAASKIAKSNLGKSLIKLSSLKSLAHAKPKKPRLKSAVKLEEQTKPTEKGHDEKEKVSDAKSDDTSQPLKEIEEVSTTDDSDEQLTSTQSPSTSETTSDSSLWSDEGTRHHRKKKKKIDQTGLKDKLKQQINKVLDKNKSADESEKAPHIKPIPSTLKKITDAPWFRRKLSVINPDKVALALMEMGDTRRVFAQGKACEALIAIVHEFLENRRKGPDDDASDDEGLYTLSEEVADKVQNFFAKFIKAKHDVTNELANHPNRIYLAENAMGAIASMQQQPSDIIKHELFRLLIDANETLREKARAILESKYSIDTFEKLCQELKAFSSENYLGAGLNKSADKLKENTKLSATLVTADDKIEEVKQQLSKAGYHVEDANTTSLQFSLHGDMTSASLVGKSFKKPLLEVVVDAELEKKEPAGLSSDTTGTILRKSKDTKRNKKATGRKTDQLTEEKIGFSLARYKIDPLPKRASSETILAEVEDWQAGSNLTKEEMLQNEMEMFSTPFRKRLNFNIGLKSIFPQPEINGRKEMFAFSSKLPITGAKKLSDRYLLNTDEQAKGKKRTRVPSIKSSVYKTPDEDGREFKTSTSSKKFLPSLPLHHLSRRIDIERGLNTQFGKLLHDSADQEEITKIRYKFRSLLPLLKRSSQDDTDTKAKLKTYKLPRATQDAVLPPIPNVSPSYIHIKSHLSEKEKLTTINSGDPKELSEMDRRSSTVESLSEYDSKDSGMDTQTFHKSWARSSLFSFQSNESIMYSLDEFGLMSSVSTIDDSYCSAERSEPPRRKSMRLPPVSDMGDSGFVESFKTKQSKIQTNQEDWRDILKRLRKFRTKGMLPDIKQEQWLPSEAPDHGRCDVIRRIFKEFLLAPEERVTSHFIVNNRSFSKEAVCQQFHDPRFYACCMGKFSFRYGIMWVKWMDYRLQQYLNNNPTGKGDFEIWNQEFIQKFQIKPKCISENSAEWKQYKDFVARHWPSHESGPSKGYASQTNQAARRKVMSILLNQKEQQKRRSKRKPLSRPTEKIVKPAVTNFENPTASIKH